MCFVAFFGSFVVVRVSCWNYLIWHLFCCSTATQVFVRFDLKSRFVSEYNEVKILGIETSCDETAVAVISGRTILGDIVLSQVEHSLYGGVVPELASRGHISVLHTMLSSVLNQAHLGFADIDLIAVTAGPGLVGSLLTGLITAKSISHVLGKCFVAVNHLEAHMLVVRMAHDISFPFIALIISGAHCQILLARDLGKYEILGQTLDDAVGETFDKVAVMLGYSYPGGKKIEQMAVSGNKHKFEFPRALMRDGDCNFSFSGLKTAVRRTIEGLELSESNIADVCASFQESVREVMCSKLKNALRLSYISGLNIRSVVVAGGVASNQYIMNSIREKMLEHKIDVYSPPPRLCTDNAVMVAWCGYERYVRRKVSDSLDFAPRPRWSIC